MHLTLARVAAAEAFFGGCAGLLLELQAMRILGREGRTLYYYHLFPMVTCVLLLICTMRPTDVLLNVATVQMTAVTTANMHNTYYVHVVAMHAQMESPSSQSLVYDFFAPRRRSSYYPWGPVREVVYSAACIAHLLFRTSYTATLLL
jgi:hypothetical protein